MVRVPLTRGLFAVIDDCDMELVLKHKWNARVRSRSAPYAVTEIANRAITMHRLIMQPPVGFEVDHIDGNGLNNTRANLRVVTSAQNRWNSSRRRDSASRFKGISEHPSGWTARIRINGVSRYLGIFQSEVNGAFAYDMAALDAFGQYARPNFHESIELYYELRRMPHPGNVCFGSMKGLE